MVGLIDSLEAKGLAARRADAGDRRRNVLELTEDGQKTLVQTVRASDNAERQLLAELDDAESAQLRTMLTRVARNRSEPWCEPDLAEVAEQVTSHGTRAMPLRVDLAATAALGQLVDRAAAELGQLDVLVNAAGTDVPGPVEGLSLADWERVVAVNLTAQFALAKAAMPHRPQRGDHDSAARGRVT